ncbi:MAG: sulfite exporter TauE/SafE family protein [Candidatus Hadarchaeales archaeon]
MPLEMLLGIIAVGAIGGYLGGIVGAGIGATVVPSLILFGIDPTVAIGSSLLLHTLISPLGGAYHYRLGHVHRKIFLPMALAGMLGAFSGANITTQLPSKELKLLVGVSTMGAGLSIVVKFPKPKNDTHHKLKELVKRLRGPKFRSIALIGLIAGLSHGALGTGWGPLGVPLLILAGTSPQTAVGSSLLARVFISLVGSSTYFTLIGLPLDIVLPLLIGGSIAMIIGASTAKRLYPKTLKHIVGIVAVVLGVLVLAKQVVT